VKIGLDTRCDGCGCPISPEIGDICITAASGESFCSADCAQEFTYARLPRHHHEHFLSRLSPPNWRQMGASEVYPARVAG
jgi:hypothetical protein